MFLSALLLFSVQPMFAKMALPAFGGTPAVWAVSMCFFQAVLLAGYIYAHALNRWLEPRTAVLTHVVVLAFAALALPIGLPATMAEPPSGDAYLWLLGVLALGVGLPFFAISANAPLLQAWFSKTEHKDASDPYFLYGASNLGSLLALLAYPIVLEPTLGLTSQGALWSFGFFALIASIAMCGGAVLLSGNATSPKASDTRLDAAAIREPISWRRRAGWIALAAIPSGLMVAVTTYVTTDVGSAPFIWVVPLALYLTTFIMVFKDKLSFPYTLAVAVLPLAILAHILLMSRIEAVAFALLAYFLAALMCHRELYLRRPGSESLTDFYICMSAGGVIGGIFSALIAPQIFSSVLEFKLLLVISLLARPGVLDGLTNRKQARAPRAVRRRSDVGVPALQNARRVERSCSRRPRARCPDRSRNTRSLSDAIMAGASRDHHFDDGRRCRRRTDGFAHALPAALVLRHDPRDHNRRWPISRDAARHDGARR